MGVSAHTLSHVELLAPSCGRCATCVEVTHKDKTVGRLHWLEGREEEEGGREGRREGERKGENGSMSCKTNERFVSSSPPH